MLYQRQQVFNSRHEWLNDLSTGNGILLEKFCYLGDVLDADGRMLVRVRCAQKNFCEYLPMLTRKRFSLKLYEGWTVYMAVKSGQ